MYKQTNMGILTLKKKRSSEFDNIFINSDVLSAQMLTVLKFEHFKFILTNIMEIHVKNIFESV